MARAHVFMDIQSNEVSFTKASYRCFHLLFASLHCYFVSLDKAVDHQSSVPRTTLTNIFELVSSSYIGSFSTDCESSLVDCVLSFSFQLQCLLDSLEWKCFEKQNVSTGFCSEGNTNSNASRSSEIWFFKVNGNGDFPKFTAKHISEGESALLKGGEGVRCFDLTLSFLPIVCQDRGQTKAATTTLWIMSPQS